jgi:hypothetical protein
VNNVSSGKQILNSRFLVKAEAQAWHVVEEKALDDIGVHLETCI